LQRRVVVGDGALLLAGVEIGKPAVVQRRGIGRVDLDRLVVVGDGFVVFGRRGVSDAAVVVDSGLLRVVLDRLVVIGDRLGKFALGLPFDAAVGIGERQGLAVVGARLDGARPGRDRLVPAALAQVSQPSASSGGTNPDVKKAQMTERAKNCAKHGLAFSPPRPPRL
jgi:hypothetical protein